jgi:hydrazine synthase alpha subunit-like protein
MSPGTLIRLFATYLLAAGSAVASPSASEARVSVEPRTEVLRLMGCPVESGYSTSGGDSRPADRAALVERRRFGRLSSKGGHYLSRLISLRPCQESSRPDANLAGEVRKLLAAQAGTVGPIVFFTRHPLTRPNAAGCMIWQSVPERWGCSIRVFDPARPEVPARTIFRDREGCVFDMSLARDARTIFFSYKKWREECWQIYQIGVDGRGLKKISRNPACYEVSPVELANGDLLFVSTRRAGYMLSETGPRSNLHVMKRDGGNVRCVSQNTLADFSPRILPDGRVLFTRWEYVDRDIEYRLGLWTQRSDGRQFQLFFGNTIREVGIFWQAQSVPGHPNLLLATFAGASGWPHGAIGLVHNGLGPEAPENRGYAWLANDFSAVGDRSHHTDGMSYKDIDDGRLLEMAKHDNEFRDHRVPMDMSVAHQLEARAGAWFDSSRWAYRDPYPVSDYLFLVSYGGGNGGPNRFALHLLDLCGNRILLYSDPHMGCYGPLLLRPQHVFQTPSIEDHAGSRDSHDDAWATVLVADVYRGLTGVKPGQAKTIQIMEQVPKSHQGPRRAYDQSPVIGYGTYYAKRCWGRVPIESDGSAHFKVPALKEVYLQVLDARGRELQRQTSSLQLMPNEVRGCIGCHEPRNTAPSSTSLPMAARRPPTRPVPPRWTDGGLIDFVTVVGPVLEKHCVRCHSGPDPEAGCDLSGDKTRLFNMAYDNLLGRSQAYRQHNLRTGRMLSQEAAKGRPLIHFYWLRRAPTGPSHPLQSGSYISRIDDYLGQDHCGQKISRQDRQRIATWIDANVPYYATYAASRPLSPGGRDLCTDIDSGRPSTWYTERFLGVYNRRCGSCHGEFPHPNDHDNIWSGRFAWINFTHPEWSPALSAHLSKEAGGRGLGTQRFEIDMPLFHHTSNPDYMTMLEAIREGRRRMLARSRVDMDR